jgi:hypothetical protein
MVGEGNNRDLPERERAQEYREESAQAALAALRLADPLRESARSTVPVKPVPVRVAVFGRGLAQP